MSSEHADAMARAFWLVFALGAIFGAVAWELILNLPKVQRAFDVIYRSMWRLPACASGQCYCRRGCEEMSLPRQERDRG